MKKILGCFLCMMFLVFGAALSVHATPVPIEDCITNATYLGGTLDLLDLDPVPKQTQQDSLENINTILELYGDTYDLLESLPDSVEDGDPIGSRSGIITLDNNQFVTLKWDTMFGVWDVSGLDSFEFTGLDADLSNYNTIPDASVMLLLGSSLLGFAIFSRKRK